MIKDDFGEVKLSGGGMDANEDDYHASLREVKDMRLWKKRLYRLAK